VSSTANATSGKKGFKAAFDPAEYSIVTLFVVTIENPGAGSPSTKLFLPKLAGSEAYATVMRTHNTDNTEAGEADMLTPQQENWPSKLFNVPRRCQRWHWGSNECPIHHNSITT